MWMRILGLTGICRPVWAFFLAYCYFIFAFAVTDLRNVPSIILGFSAMLFFFLGHFSLNAIYDRDFDRVNPRKDFLNSWSDDSHIKSTSWIWSMIVFFWMVSISLSLLHSLLFEKLLPLIIILAILLAIGYSVPPLYVKGRAPWDIIINICSFGIIGPLFVLSSFSTEITLHVLEILVILLFSSSTLVVVVIPTILMDSEADGYFGLNTLAVKYSKDQILLLIKFCIIIQIISLSLIGIEFLWNYNFVGVFVIVSFLLGERMILSPLFDLQLSNAKAGMVATNLFFFFLISSCGLFIFILITRITNIDLNSLIKILLGL
ncbi:MAG: UbiA family prenyltransferase [Candidatus Heimdallarchaeota archaeon]|nr:UbiA family prenyltransferase [Candidatus Heimdallarchaeota archaeon]